MRGTWRLRRWIRQMAPKALILLYHRVTEVSTDPQLLCVSPQHFAEHLEVLRRDYHPLSLQSLCRRLAFNLWPPRSVVVTFDDGYADNLHQALPLLQRYNIPATIFVASGQIGRREEFWWDELERILLTSSALPDTLHLSIGARSYQWTQLRNPDADSTAWNVLADAVPSPRQQCYRDLCALVRPLPADEQRDILCAIRSWAGVTAEGRSTHRSLTAVELRILDRAGPVEIGAHTISHPMLSALDADAQRAEILTSKRQLEEIVEHSITTFSYPYGSRSDYTPVTVDWVREAGFTAACSNYPSAVTCSTDAYQLPRYLVRDWDGDEFARRLKGWFANA